MRRSRGFTLIELMVVITIIGMLASMVMFAMFQAQTAARKARTAAMVVKLHAVVARRWDTYEHRRMPVDLSGVVEPKVAAMRRLMALRQMQRVEMPDRWSDVDADMLFTGNADALPPITGYVDLNNDGDTTDTDETVTQSGIPRPAVSLAYFEYVQNGGLAGAATSGNAEVTGLTSTNNLTTGMSVIGTNIPGGATIASVDSDSAITLSSAVNFTGTVRLRFPTLMAQFQNAECLYMIVTVGLMEEGDGLSLFSEKDTGDADGDGFKEFVDGWGVPIRFLRWPVGFVNDPRQDSTSKPFGYLSDLQPSKMPANATAPWKPCVGDFVDHHDPFDPRRVSKYAYALFPLIYSAGPDKIADIFSGPSVLVPAAVDNPFYDVDIDVNNGSTCANYDPVAGFIEGDGSVGMPKLIGIPCDLKSWRDGVLVDANKELNHTDNIHNHLIGDSTR